MALWLMCWTMISQKVSSNCRHVIIFTFRSREYYEVLCTRSNGLIRTIHILTQISTLSLGLYKSTSSVYNLPRVRTMNLKKSEKKGNNFIFQKIRTDDTLLKQWHRQTT